MSDAAEIEIPEAHREILAANSIGLLSTIRHRDGLISTNPVGYVWDGECVRVSTIKGRVKYANLMADPTVTFCVVDAADPTKYVELRGFATIAEDPDKSFLARQFRAGGTEPPEDLDALGADRVVVRIHPRQSSSPDLYGGRFSRDT
jgi:PPOX class probable F420-dependent enzyme